LQIARGYAAIRQEIKDRTTLIIVDEAERLKMAGLDQIRDVFDRGGIGVMLIGMPGLEKRLARYPQLYSRVGFVHEFRPLSQAEVRQLLLEQGSPPQASLPDDSLADEEGISTIIRVTGGNFRLLHCLLTQVGSCSSRRRPSSCSGTEPSKWSATSVSSNVFGRSKVPNPTTQARLL
jgi:DNA transposition AAA+ family ATPase